MSTNEEIIETLRCAADLCNGNSVSAALTDAAHLTGVHFYAVYQAAMDVLGFDPIESMNNKQTNLLEAAQRIEESL